VYISADQLTSDFTATLTPALDSRLRAGRTTALAATSVEMLYFRKAKEQRSLSFSQTGRWDVPFNRVSLFVGGARLTTHQRPNIEIDERIRQQNMSAIAGVSLRAGARTRIAVSEEQRRLRHGDEDDSPESATIARALDRRSRITRGDLAVDLTPLTTFTTAVEYTRDRFEQTGLRDSDAVSVAGGFTFKPSALISGTVQAGYKHFTPLNKSVPGFDGIIASISASYLWRDRTRISTKVRRDIDYSIEAAQPYFVTVDAEVGVTQAISSRWDVVLQTARGAIDYRGLSDADVETIGRQDRILRSGGGVGFRLQPGTRVGFDVTYARRTSPLDNRKYEGYHYGGSFSYVY
jgi:hypothetical protein